MSRLSMTVNGRPVELDVPESRYLSAVLRDDLGLTDVLAEVAGSEGLLVAEVVVQVRVGVVPGELQVARLADLGELGLGDGLPRARETLHLLARRDQRNPHLAGLTGGFLERREPRPEPPEEAVALPMAFSRC